MNMLSTIRGSLLEKIYPSGWDLAKIDACCSHVPETITQRQAHWHADFEPVACESLDDFAMLMGHEIALEIKRTRDEGRKLIMILPVGPMGMYRWVVFFLKSWQVSASHVYGFNMDEWSDADGNTVPGSDKASFQNAMQDAFYGPLSELGVPECQRNFATREVLPSYGDKIAALKAEGARQVLVFGVGRVFHIAFWEPHFAAEYTSVEEWKKPTHRLGAKLHPLTIEQNALTSFKSRYTLVPCFANTIGPGVFMGSDRIIGGCDGVLGRGMQWQGLSLWVTLRYGPDKWVPSSFMPTLPGKLFFMRELAGPLVPDAN
ncbi:MAG: glucosamine-6-phosphate isomerase [Chloroflexi bacterium]|nr:glucosamine-6-phosphate isomerase [Chloroflexota bacterium]